ncbi:MAG: hypothetical protein ACXWQQ_07800 [Pseudobdellovibrio sp.]
MKTQFKFLVLALSLAVSAPSFAANQCSILFRPVADARPTASLSAAKKAVENLKTIEFSTDEAKAIKTIVGRTVTVADIKNTNDFASALRAKIEAGAGDALAKGEKYSKIVEKITPILDKRVSDFLESKGISRSENQIFNVSKDDFINIVKEKNPDWSDAKVKTEAKALVSEYEDAKLEVLRAKFAFSENIVRLEEFKLSEYKTSNESSLNTPGYVIVALNEYPEFAMALAKKKDPPRPYGSGGVLSYEAYRDIVSSNMWLFTLQGHDLKHIHFANSHPMATAALFRSTRSKNHLRYTLISGCYEGVDTVQYGWESAIARHFDSKGYSLEQAMLEIAIMPNDKLQALAQEVGITANHFDNWKPTKVPKNVLPDNVNVASEYENDIIKFMAKSLSDLANPRINIYMRPELIPEGITLPDGTSMKPGEIIHHW